MSHIRDRLEEFGATTKRLSKEFPDETGGFLQFLQKAESGGALPLKEKELINTALAVAGQCEWCIAFHVKSAVKAGANRNELVEAGFQAVIMHGGPAFAYMNLLMAAIDEFLPE